MVPGVHQVVAGRLAGRVGAARVVGGGFREAAGGAKGAEHLISTDVMKTKTSLAPSAQTFPVGPHRLQQLKGAAHISLDKGPRPLNRAVHVALGRQV